MPPTKAADVTEMLRRHYLPDNRPPGGVFAPEIQSPDGTRRADLIWLSTTTSGRRFMVGHEVKVSRADVMVELRDPAKSEPWMQYCNQWWLVLSSQSLIDGLEVPEPWGIMAPPSGRRTRSMTILRPAPTLSPIAAADGVARVTAWLNNKYVDLQGSVERETAWRDRTIAQLREQVATLQQGAPRQLSPHAQRIWDIHSEVEKRLRRGGHFAVAEDSDIVAAIVDLATVRRQVRTVVRSLEGLDRSVASIAAAVAALPAVTACDDMLDFGEASA